MQLLIQEERIDFQVKILVFRRSPSNRGSANGQVSFPTPKRSTAMGLWCLHLHPPASSIPQHWDYRYKPCLALFMLFLTQQKKMLQTINNTVRPDVTVGQPKDQTLQKFSQETNSYKRFEGELDHPQNKEAHTNRINLTSPFSNGRTTT